MTVNDMVNTFNCVVLSLLDAYAPQKVILIRERSYPWITHTIKEMMRLRDEAYNTYKASGLDRDKLYYHELKKCVNKALFHETRAYFNQNINRNASNSRALWNNLKRTIRITKNSHESEIPSHLRDPERINLHFLEVAGNITPPQSYFAKFETSCFHDSTFRLEPVGEDLVLKIIKTLKSSALGDDGISLDMLLLTLPHTLGAITAIINKSISTSVFPDAWKVALVTPLPKTNNVTSFKDLRPISILPCLSKILERVVYMQLSAFLETNKVLPTLQSGFRKSRSTTTALLDVVDNILSAQNKGHSTIMVLLDFSRAFDAINTQLLLSKMRYYGFESDTVAWFASYLGGRTQVVQIPNNTSLYEKSKPSVVSRCVPQGSILGPLLFILYTLMSVVSLRIVIFTFTLMISKFTSLSTQLILVMPLTN